MPKLALFNPIVGGTEDTFKNIKHIFEFFTFEEHKFRFVGVEFHLPIVKKMLNLLKMLNTINSPDKLIKSSISSLNKFNA
ncbi:hypothetical protein BpHYR1_036416 [Brachionus plicatilis]|uniref:Uncharacterized protein n=1 Tax=Brachionus plicatilis TaxID=10195 RepID=A0A3M7SJ16_BRAPC|nr:hypothetical protein BpHYR1_036416 [Brachionus plicatilis]